MEIDPSEITIPSASLDLDGDVIVEHAQVNVLILCGENTGHFVITIAIDGIPDDVNITLPGATGSGVNCESGDPPAAVMFIDVFEASPGTYTITLTAQNFDQSDFVLAEPATTRQATLTMIITPPAQ
jgi:hypothetical protein